jgi:hypothetical protein|nr:hypothetical protein [Kofleriaceae bacterium]
MKRTLGLAIVLAAAACNAPGISGTDPTGGGGGDGGGGDPINGSGTQDAPVPTSQGTYQLTSHVDLSIELVLPAQAELVVSTLRTFATDPGKALLELPAAAGVPAVGTLLSLVPGVLKDKLEGWIDGFIDPISIHGVKLTDAAGAIANLAQTALTKVDVDSTLDIHGGSATQTFTAIDLSPAGIDHTIPLGAVPTDLVSATTTASYTDASLQLGDEHFGFEYGEYAWQAVNAACTDLFGGDIRTTLGTAVDCSNLAHDIASKCVLGVCVGHDSDVEAACNAGLDFVVDQVHQQFDAIDLDAVHYASGTATLVDVDGDGVADQITNGTWDAELNVGLGLRKTPATFDGTR